MKTDGGEETPTTRPYRMQARAAAAERTAQRILSATFDLWHDVGLDEMTLQQVADRAGVTVQTVLRRFGSKDGLIDAGLEQGAKTIIAQRNSAPHGDVRGALDVLLDHYEEWGDASLRTVEVEARYPAAAKVARYGREAHRDWCRRYLAPPQPDETLLDALVAATDAYCWKLLRRDLGRSREQTLNVMERLVTGVLGTGQV